MKYFLYFLGILIIFILLMVGFITITVPTKEEKALDKNIRAFIIETKGKHEGTVELRRSTCGDSLCGYSDLLKEEEVNFLKWMNDNFIDKEKVNW